MTAHFAVVMWHFLGAHLFVLGVICSWVFSAYAAKGLKDPTPTSSRVYQFWYYLIHLAAANLDRFSRKV